MNDPYEHLLKMLAAAFEGGDPLPDGFIDDRRSYVQWASPGAGIGELVDELPVLRDALDASPSVVIDLDDVRVTISRTPPHMGHITPWTSGQLHVDHDAGVVTLDVDDHGDFEVPPLRGLIRLRLETIDRRWVSPWCYLTDIRST